MFAYIDIEIIKNFLFLFNLLLDEENYRDIKLYVVVIYLLN